MKLLRTLPLVDRYFAGVEKEINRLFREILYIPLGEATGLTIKELTNAKDPLIAAIDKGTVWFERGLFHGEYSAAISRRLIQLGAVFNSRSKTWTFSGALPAEVGFAVAAADARFSAMRSKVLDTLSSIRIDNVDRISRLSGDYETAIDWMEADFQKTVAQIEIKPRLSQAQRNKLAEEWGENLDLYVKDWLSENIVQLRTEVMANTFAGRRAESIVAELQKNYGISKAKAKFLARQETSLLLSKFRETRYSDDLGLETYVWRGSMDERERPDHKALEGKVCRWDDPPIVNKKSGATAHPGEDYGCRCVAQAVID